MKNKSTKIAKLLYKAKLAKNEAFDTKKEKKFLKKINLSEKLSRKALELARADISAGVNQGFNDLICSIYLLTSLLCRTDRQNDAESLLAEARSLEGFEGHMYSIAINSYYGCILCDRGEYNAAGEIFDKVMDDAKVNDYAATIDTYALCEAYGNAACAFTYADTEIWYPAERFTEPLDRLLEIRQKGFEVDIESLKKASYFAASQRLYYMCFGVITASDSASTIKTAETCLDFCQKSEQLDFYIPAAMQIIAFAAARDLRFGDCSEFCSQILEICSKYTEDMGKSPYGSIQSIAADINLLLGIMHYRANHFETSVKYFDAAIAALEADAHGKPLDKIGYVEVEANVIAMTSAEKAAFAYTYKGLALCSIDKSKNLSHCLTLMQKGAELISSVSDDPYFHLRASAEYNVMAQVCKSVGDAANAAKFADLNQKHGYSALSNLNEYIGKPELYEKYISMLESRKRLALRHGLLEQYSDCLRYEIMLREEPYAKPDHSLLAELNFHMGELCRVLDRYESAVGYYDNVHSHSFDDNGNMYDALKESGMSGDAMLAKASCLVKLGKMSEASKSFKKFTEIDKITSNGELSLSERIRIAKLAENIGLSSDECAEYMHIAAEMSLEAGDDPLRSAEMLNREGICWYKAGTDKSLLKLYGGENSSEGSEFLKERYERLNAEFAANELDAFQKSYCEVLKCDPENPTVLELMPMLLSNIAECHMRGENFDESLKYYQKSVEAFENLLKMPLFAEKDDDIAESCLFQYGSCFKAMGIIYEHMNDSENSAKSLTRAIEVFEKINSDEAREQLSSCLNARGCMNYRMGNYQNEVDDITRAISLHSNEESGLSVAIMLKNRSDAYQALGDYRAMQADLTKSIDILDKSDVPDGALDSMYGENWYSLGVCLEELNKAGRAADSYRTAEKYLTASQSSKDDMLNTMMRIMCHFRRANCLYLRDEQEYYGALSEYDNAVKLLEELPPSMEKNQRLIAVLTSRGSLYETFREIDLAKADYAQAEQLRKDSPQSLFSTSGNNENA